MSERRIKDAYDRLKSETIRRVSPGEGLKRIHGVRWYHRALLPALGFATVIIALLAVVAVLDGPAVESPQTAGPDSATTLPGTTVPPATTIPPATTVPKATTVPSTTPPTALPEVPEPVAMPPFAPIEEGALLIASNTGVIAVESAGPRAISTVPARLAVSDGYGGIVYQDDGHPGAARIWRLPTEGGVAELLLGKHSALHDMAVIDGVPTLIYAFDNAQGAEVGGGGDYSGTVWLLRLDGGGQSPLATFPTYEGGIGRISYGGGIFAAGAGSEGLDWFHVVDASGEPLDSINPVPFDGQTGGAHQPMVSPDGEVLIYLESDPDDFEFPRPTHLVVWSLSQSRVISRTQLPLGDFEAGRVDYDGGMLVISRLARSYEPGFALVIDGIEIDTATLSVAPFPGRVSLAVPVLPEGPSAQPAPIPAGSFGEGYIVARSDTTVWGPHGSSVDVDDYRVVTRTGFDPYLGGVQAVGDGHGNVITYNNLGYTENSGAVMWLRQSGQIELFSMINISEASPDSAIPNSLTLEGTAIVGGRPTLFTVMSFDDAPVLGTVDLLTRETRLVAALGTHDTWVHSVSYGRGRFVISTTTGTCTDVFALRPDGSPTDLANVPVPACDGLPQPQIFSARVSPDGTVLVYLEAVAGPSQFEELAPTQWVSPVLLVVRDINSGIDLHRRTVTEDPFAWVVIHDFDGRRIVLSSEPIEPAAAEQEFEIIDLQHLGDVVTFTGVLANVKLIR